MLNNDSIENIIFIIIILFLYPSMDHNHDNVQQTNVRLSTKHLFAKKMS